METTSLPLLPGENIVAGIHNLPGHFLVQSITAARRLALYLLRPETPLQFPWRCLIQRVLLTRILQARIFVTPQHFSRAFYAA